MIETAIDYKALYEDSVRLHEDFVKESLAQMAALRHELANLKRLIHGSKNERFIPSNGTPSQLSLDIQTDAIAQCSIVNTKKIEYRRNIIEVTREHPGRTKLPGHLERREVIIEPQEKTEGCKKIGEEIT